MSHLTELIKGGAICELYGLSYAHQNPEPFIKSIADLLSLNLVQIILFSDNEEYTNGKAIAKYIRDNKLGTLKETTPEKSLNTGSIINTWMWYIDKKALAKWNQKRAHRSKAYIGITKKY